MTCDGCAHHVSWPPPIMRLRGEERFNYCSLECYELHNSWLKALATTGGKP